MDVALSRACLAFLGHLKHNSAPDAATDFIAWLTRYMQGYPMLRAQYLAVSEKAAAAADLVVDGALPAEPSAALVRKVLDRHGVLA